MLNSGNNCQFWPRMIWKFDGSSWKTIVHPFYATSSFARHFVAISKFRLESQSGNAQFGDYLVPFDLEIWVVTLKHNKASLLCHFKLCASFCSHHSIKTRVTVRKRPNRVKISGFWYVFFQRLRFGILWWHGEFLSGSVILAEHLLLPFNTIRMRSSQSHSGWVAW